MRWLLCCCERRKWAAGSKDRIVQRPSFILFSARATAAARGAAVVVAAQCGLLQLRLTKPTTATATVKSGQWCERRRRMKRCF